MKTLISSAFLGIWSEFALFAYITLKDASRTWYLRYVLQIPMDAQLIWVFTGRTWLYSKTCEKWPLKNRQNKDLDDKW